MKARCRVCGKEGETEPPIFPDEQQNAPIIIWCDECEDFVLADIIR